MAPPVVQQIPKLQAVPAFRSFDGNSEDWRSYFKQFQFFLINNSVANEEKKKAALLSNIGGETFNLLQSLIALLDISAADVTLQLISDTLDTVFIRISSLRINHLKSDLVI